MHSLLKRLDHRDVVSNAGSTLPGDASGLHLKRIGRSYLNMPDIRASSLALDVCLRLQHVPLQHVSFVPGLCLCCKLIATY